MAGYSKSYNKANGQFVDATDFNNEFGALDTAFALSGGHEHAGGAHSGAYIPFISNTGNNGTVQIDEATGQVIVSTNVGGIKTEQLRFIGAAMIPTTTNTVDLGSATNEFKDVYIAGTLHIPSLTLGAGTATAIVDDITLVGNSALTLPTEHGVKGYVDGQVTGALGQLTTHAADYTLHLTVDQNTFLDNLNLPTLLASEVNFLQGATSNIQTQLNNKLNLAGGTMTGTLTVTPSAGVAIVANGVALTNTVTIQANSTSGQSLGVVINGGTTSADYALSILDATGLTSYLKVFGDGGVTIGAPTGGDIGAGTLNTAGNIYVNNSQVTTVTTWATTTTGGVIMARLTGTDLFITNNGVAP